MGNCASSQVASETRSSTITSRAIDKLIQEERDNAIAELKILLLGTGDSGKTTVLKQLRLLYGNGFAPEEILEFRSVLLQNVLTCSKSLLSAMNTLQIPFGFDPKNVVHPPPSLLGKPALSIAKLRSSKSNMSLNHSLGCLPGAQPTGSKSSLRPKPNAETPIAEAARNEYAIAGGLNQKGRIVDCAEKVKALKTRYGFGKEDFISPEIAEAMKTIWQDSGIQYCFMRRNEFNLQENCQYLMENLTRICAADFVPTEVDIVNARLMTQTVSKTIIQFEGETYSIFDVGGQKSQRKKWAPFFSDVKAVIFVVALSSYDQVCVEDTSLNRITDALNVFNVMINLPSFSNIDFIVKKLAANSLISDHFPTYTGPNSYEEGSEFFVHEFAKLNRNRKRDIIFHLTFATDGKLLQPVMDAVFIAVMKTNLKAAGLI
ncbi:guanine nucleotide binding protein, alpha subunit [Obelidium mucronatum]|nr:guanine nucleotide binding protein, alpha subunit [Obelidium mucronatum]